MLTGKPTGQRPLGRSRRRWEDNIRMKLLKNRYQYEELVDWAEDRENWRALVNATLNLRVP